MERDQASLATPGYRRGSGALRLVAVGLAVLAFSLLTTPHAGAAFGFNSYSSAFTAAGGEEAPGLQAGSHPGSVAIATTFITTGPPGEELLDGALRDLTIALPPGLVGAPAQLPSCAHAEYLAESCPPSTAVGDIVFDIGTSIESATVYLLDPLPGVAAQLGFYAKSVPATIDLFVAAEPPHNLIARISSASQAAELHGTQLVLYGLAGDRPFLTLPRACPAPLLTTATAVSWQSPPLRATAVAGSQHTVACGDLSYQPTLHVAPTTAAASAPSGLDLELDAPDPGLSSAAARAAADTAAARLTLPPGMTLNPPLAAGLAACTPAQLAAERADAEPGAGCPEAAKIGTATVSTPILSERVTGSLYVAQPDDPASVAAGAENPFNSALALYLVLRQPERGILVRLPIRVDADPATGRLSAVLEQIPALPISHLSLRLNSGPRAPLTTPRDCGTGSISYVLTPSSGGSPLRGNEAFAMRGNCPGAFTPQLGAGTTSNAAGSGAPLIVSLTNSAAAANIDALSVTLPPGLAADLGAAAPCPEPAVSLAACPVDSRLGEARIALGSGPEPLWVPSGERPGADVFLAGPYRDAPYSLLVRLPAAAGPFDLGQVVLRGAIRIDPDTAQATVTLDDLPQIQSGVPLRYRSIRLALDRPGFIRNPTSCEPSAIVGTAGAADGSSAALHSRFQAADCAALRFRPRLSVRFSGGLGRGAHPRIRIRLAPRGGEANLAAADLALPAGQLLDLHRIRALCPRGRAPERCPRTSRLGRVVLRSPIAPAALAGPIYLRRPARGYPDLIAAVRGGDLRLRLHGSTRAARGGRLAVRIARLPDLPLSRAEISIAGGARGIFANSESLCGKRPRAAVRLRAQNGKRYRTRPRVRLGGRC